MIRKMWSSILEGIVAFDSKKAPSNVNTQYVIQEWEGGGKGREGGGKGREGGGKGWDGGVCPHTVNSTYSEHT